MNLAVLERRRPMRQRRIGPNPNDPRMRLPLRAELFLIAHSDETGRNHLSRQALNLGLAGAVLLELWLTGRIQIGKQYHIRNGRYVHDTGRITIVDPGLLRRPAHRRRHDTAAPHRRAATGRRLHPTVRHRRPL
jgi:hypothetical protein